MSRGSIDDDENEVINTELIWSFDNVQTQLVQKYPLGKAYSETLACPDKAYEWQVDFYPNGRDNITKNKICLVVKLLSGELNTVDAECQYSMQMRGDRGPKNFVGEIKRQEYERGETEAEHCEFDTSMLDIQMADTPSCKVNITIKQFPKHRNVAKVASLRSSASDEHEVKKTSQISSATPQYAPMDEEDEFKKVVSKPLY